VSFGDFTVLIRETLLSTNTRNLWVRCLACPHSSTLKWTPWEFILLSRTRWAVWKRLDQQTKEQEHEMKLDREATHHFMFQEFWASHYPLVQALSTFPILEFMPMAHTAHPRYTSGWASSAKVELGSWWKQLRGDKGRVPELPFESRQAIDRRADTRTRSHH